MSTSVKYITSEQRGSPTINGTAGTLIAALDALFTTGRGVTTALGITVSGGIATAALTSGQSFDRDAVVLIAGATPGALNGEARVLSTGAAFITWATSAPDGVATGTITIKYAPQTSWEKVFSATNKAVYRSTDVTGNRHYLRVDDTGTTTARVRGFEAMTDVDTGTGPFPTDEQVSGGGYWVKSSAANATANRYMIFCDEKAIIIAIAIGSGANASFLTAPARGFGDFIDLAISGDAWGTVLSASTGNTTQNNVAALDSALPSSVSGFCASPRAFSGLGGSVLGDSLPFTGLRNTESGSCNHLGAAPSPISGKIHVSKLFIKPSGTGTPPRSETPGVYYIPQENATAVLRWGDKLELSGSLAGRRLVAIGTSQNGITVPTGVYLVDLTAWR